MSDELLALAETLYFPLQIRIQEPTRYQYRIALADFSRFLCHSASTADLQDDTITRWMSQRLKDGLAAVTVRERAGRLQTLWTWLAKRRIVQHFPTFQKPRVPETLPTALNESQLRSLFESAARERGSICGVPSNLWWTSFLAFVWTTAERKSAALAVKVAWVDFQAATCTIPPQSRKGGSKWGVYHLWPETMELLRRCLLAQPTREQMWPVDFCHESYYTRYNRILKDAGIPVSRRTKTHALRCSHATWLSVAGGDPTKQLGHTDRATTERYYIDRKFTDKEQPKLFIPWSNPDAG